jgi:hypothetical protein
MDADCNAWRDCFAQCIDMNFTAACFDACDTANPNAAALSGPLTTCLCMTCSTQCAPFCS